MSTIYDELALALQHHQAGDLQAAEQIYRHVLTLNPTSAEAIFALANLGTAMYFQGRLDEAVTCHRHSLQLDPNFALGYNNLGMALQAQGHLSEAVVCYRRTLELQPDCAYAHNNLGNALQNQGLLADAIASYKQALALQPSAGACNNLGNAFKDQGLLAEALAYYRQGVELEPGDASAHSNLLYTLHFCPGVDAQTILDEHRRWNERHARHLGTYALPHANDPAPGRRLRIGYVSPDFILHPVGRFLLPLLEAHDHKNFEIYCYASVRTPDTLTEQCRSHADAWRYVFGVADEELARAIRRDQVDILVDLSMHTSENRLLAFARKPAPVQVTYLAYCSTTGLSAMDYRLTDPYFDPRPIGLMGPISPVDPPYAETSIWLPHTYWCYRPAIATSEASQLPALQTGHITFGCLNNFCKVTEPTLTAWTNLLQALPDARMLLHARAGGHRERVKEFFAAQRVAPERLRFVDLVQVPEYFRIYEQVDLTLDPFPYGGGTTTCDSLWMGCPVVTLAGRTAVGRAGLSILSNVGLPELVAHDTGEYVRIAVDLAHDIPRLGKLRAGLRERMVASPLMDAPRFARAVEAAYRDMWRRWCSRGEA